MDRPSTQSQSHAHAHAHALGFDDDTFTQAGYDLNGAHVVVLGRSNIVGLPVAMMALHRNATVTCCHSRTKNLPDVVRTADILIAAIGQPEFVKGDWIKPGACVIDVYVLCCAVLCCAVLCCAVLFVCLNVVRCESNNRFARCRPAPRKSVRV